MATLMDTRGQIDVVIPAFNADKYIDQTLASVSLQGDIVRTVFVINDGSTDQTQAIVETFAKSHPKLAIEIIKQKNAGLANARNTGIKASLQESKAPYIALLDADDVWLTGKLDKQLSVFQASQDSKLGLVYSSYELINENGSAIAGENLIVKPSLRGEIYSALLTGNFISGSGSGVLVKSNVFEEIGLFDEALKASEDWDMWIRIARKFHFDYVNESLVQIRVHSSNMQKDFSRMLASELAMLNKFAQHSTHNYFLLWKIQTILFKKKMSATQINGFDSSEPWVKAQLTGYKRFLWQLLLPIATAIWVLLKKLKKSLSS
jgi:glycosyltransferase involved in cell wall biosynthesis